MQDAWKWMHAQARRFGIDRGRIATGGASAGGYLAQMTGFCLNPRPRALISYFGYGDIVGPWYSQPDEFYRRQPLVSKVDALAAIGTVPISEPPQGNQRDKFYLYCRQNGLWPMQVSGHDPHTEDKWFTPYCPIRNVTGKYPPTILIHGATDTEVPYSLSKDMDATGKGGVAHEFITVGGAGHGLAGAKPEESVASSRARRRVCDSAHGLSQSLQREATNYARPVKNHVPGCESTERPSDCRNRI